MPTEVERQLQRLGHGDHLCLIYDHPQEQLAAAIPFIREGLARNECCVYIADEHTAAEIAEALSAAGIDVEGAQARGALALLTKKESYLRAGAFDPNAMIEFLRETTEQAIRDGFTAFRVTGEMTWALGPECGCDRLIEYEAYLNEFFPGSKALAICQYNRQRFSPEMVYDVLRTHPTVVVGGEVCPNPFYEPPLMVLEEPTPTYRVNWRRVDWMISQLQRARVAERSRQELTDQLAQQTQAMETELQQRERAEALIRGQNEVLELIARGAPLSQVLEALARTAEAECGAEAVTGILLLDEDGVTLRHGAAPSLPDSYNRAVDGIRIDPDLGSCAAAASRGELVIVEDIAAHPNWEPIRYLALAQGLHAAWSMPILSSTGKVLGTFGTYYRRPRGPVARDLEVVEILSRTAGVAIERWWTEKALRESNGRLRLLTETAIDALRGGTPQEFISAVYRRLESVLGLEVFFHYQLPPGGERMRLAAYSGVSEACAQEIEELALGQAVCGQVALHGRPIIAECIVDSAAAETALVRSLGITAYACHPLLAGGRMLGTLSFGTRKRERFSPEEVELMRAVCDQVAAAVQRWLLETELQERAEALAEADRRKNEFLAMLAHELRNPLAPITNSMAILRHRAGDERTVLRQRELIERNARHLARLVDDLLEVSRINEGKIELRPERVDLAAMVEQAASSTRATMELQGHTLSISVPLEPVTLPADPTRMVQVLVNLLNNAAKYTPASGRITLIALRDGDEAVLRVQDNGRGIEPHLLPRIFDLFVQGKQSLARSEGGLGIGLTLVKRLVELHGGMVEVRSDGPGKGSEFTVRLPAEPAPPTQRSSGDAGLTDAEHWPRRILVVEDNRDAAETLAELLELWGHEVCIVPDGHAALEAAQSFRPEVVLLDLGLPDLDGYEIARRLRAGSQPPLLVALTGYGNHAPRRLTESAGFDHHLTKPVDPDALRALLASAAR